MVDRSYGVGIVGFGFMGRTHAYAYRTIPFFYSELPIHYRLKAVCTRAPEAIVRAVDVGGFESGVTDYRQLLDRDDIDIIHVCTPNVLHKAMVIDALRAGKHVYCDKPLAASYAECREIVAAVEKYGRGLTTQVALQYRYLPATMRAKQLIDEGFLGRIWSFRACYLHSSSINPNKPITWKLDKAKGGGGVLLDIGSHILDLLGQFVGPFDRLIADSETFIKRRPRADTGEVVDVQTDDITTLLLRTKDGAMGTVEASKLATGVNDELRFEIHGEKGAMRFNLMDTNWLEVYDTRDAAEPIGGMRGFKKIETCSRYPAPGGQFPGGGYSVGWTRAHVACLYNFLAAIGGKAEARPDFAEAAELQRLMETAYTSAERRTWMSVAEP